MKNASNESRSIRYSPFFFNQYHFHIIVYILKNSTVVTSTVVTSTFSTDILQNYLGALTRSSNTFVQFGEFRDKHYYETIQVMVSELGDYSFTSVSKIDLYGYLYLHDFDPSKTCKNLLTQNDDATPDTKQFQIVYEFEAGMTYIIMVTTLFPSVTGAFSIVSSGPGNVSFLPKSVMMTLTSTVMTPATGK